MPTVILLDVSLSMCRVIGKHGNGGNEGSKKSDDGFIEIRQLANVGIGTLLDYLAQNAQLEHTALVVYSSLWEIKHDFTRNHESIKNGIYDLELYDKSNIVNAIRGILDLKLDEWAQNEPINIILVTDGQLHHDYVDLPNSDSTGSFHDLPLSEIEGQFNFPCKIQIVCLISPQDLSLKNSLPSYKRLVSIINDDHSECPILTSSNTRNFKQSAIWLPDSESSEVSIKSVEDLFLTISELHYKPYLATLSCGHLCSMVMLSPRPSDASVEPLKNDHDDLKKEQSLKNEPKETYVNAISKVRHYKLSNEINICGFLPISEIASPAVLSRHLVIPIQSERFDETSKATQILSQDPNAYNKLFHGFPIGDALQIESAYKQGPVDIPSSQKTTPRSSRLAATSSSVSPENDSTKQPSFCVMLLNALKQESMVAICIIGKNEETGESWYGMLHSYNDSRRKYCMLLSPFIPSPNPILWLPNLKTMGSSLLNAELPQPIRDKISSNPRKHLKSYSSNSVIWLSPESVQTDIQKIVRHSKRSPDRAIHFFKELNRIRKAAISYGFYDVLFGVASILEREKDAMLADQSRSANQEMIRHIDHAITCLRANLNEDSYETNIAPKS